MVLTLVKSIIRLHLIVLMVLILARQVNLLKLRNVTVGEVTASTATLSWQKEYDNVVIDIFLDEEFIGQFDESTVVLEELENDKEYRVAVKTNGSDEWSTFVKTAKCPENWSGFLDSCYLAFDETEKQSWADAMDICKSMQGHLTDPQSVDEMYFISSSKVIKFRNKIYWIGINTRETDTPVYSDSTPVDHEILAMRFQGTNATEKCNALQAVESETPEWKDLDCQTWIHYICEYKLPQPPTELKVQTNLTQVTLYWTPPSTTNKFVQNRVFLFTKSFGIIDRFDVPVAVNFFLVPSSLVPGELYFISMDVIDKRTEANSARSEILPFVTDPPPPPGLYITSLSSTSASIEWKSKVFDMSFVFNGFVMRYYKRNFGDDFMEGEVYEISLLNTTHSHVLEGLEPYRNYTVNVYAISSHNTTMGNIQTLSYPVLTSRLEFLTDVSPPFDLHIVENSLEERSFAVEWTPAIGIVDRYIVNMSDENERLIIEGTTYLPTEELIYNAMNLIPGYLYNVSVSTKRWDAVSVPVTIQQRTKPHPPNKDHFALERISLEVKVKIFHNPDKVGYSDGYQIVFESPNELIRWPIPLQNDSNIQEAVFYELTPGQEYSVKVHATSSDVLSYPVEIASSITVGVSSPSQFRLDWKNETMLILSWKASKGVIEKYLVSCYGIDRKCPVDVKSKSINEGESITFNNLIPGARYTYTVQSQKGNLLSSGVELSVRTLPLPPSTVKEISKNETSAKLSWISGGGIYSGFRIIYTPVDVANYTHIPLNGSKDIPAGTDTVVEMTLVGLLPGTSYDLQVMTVSEDTVSRATYGKTTTSVNPVYAIEVSELGDTFFTVNWKPGYGGYEFFEVLLATYESSQRIFETTYTARNLKPSHVYEISVWTVSHYEQSSPTTIQIQTRPVKVSEILIDIVDENSFTVHWERPASGEYDAFELHISSESYMNTETLESFEFSTAFDSLIAGQEYILEIYSSYRNVLSFPSESKVILYPFSPSEVLPVEVTSTSIVLKWETPFGEVDFFEVTLIPSHGEVSMVENSAELTKLVPGAIYNISVKSISHGVSSRFPAYTTLKTLEAAPGLPSNLSVSIINTTTVNVQWNEPDNPNGLILFYIVQHKQLFPHPELQYTRNMVNHPSTFFTLMNLEPGASYHFQIQAENSAGPGNWTEERLVRTPESTPGPVANLTAELLTSKRIVISWKPPLMPNGVIEKYLLTVHDESGTEIATVNFQRDENSDIFECFLDRVPKSIASELLLKYIQSLQESNTETHPFFSEGLLKASTTERESTDTTVMSALPITGNSNENTDTTQAQTSPPIIAGMTVNEPQVTNAPLKTSSSDASRVRRDIPQTLEMKFKSMCPVSYNLKNLEPYTRYQIVVRAWTAVGGGIPTSIKPRTLQEPPGGPPRNLSTSFIGPRSVQVDWQPPEKPNGEILYTLLLESVVGTDEYFNNETSILLAGLLPISTYAIVLHASTAAGNGLWTNWYTVTTDEDFSEAPIMLNGKVLSSSSVMLSWYPPEESNGMIRGYKIEVFDTFRMETYDTKIMDVKDNVSVPAHSKPRDFSQHHDTATISSEIPELPEAISSLLGKQLTTTSRDIIELDISDLRPYTPYRFLVSALNSAGYGEPVTYDVMTAEDKPGSPPINLSYVNLTSTSVNITWSKPQNPNGEITRYTVYISQQQIFVEETVSTFAVIQNLTKYSPYRVFVAARTSKGDGPSSKELYIHTDEDTPDSPPTNLRYENISSSVIKLLWSPPDSPNGIIRFYEIFYKNKTGEYSVNSTMTFIFVENLRAYGEYMVQISASTRLGDGGLRSEPLYVRTEEGQPATPPYNLSYTNLTSTSIMIYWNEPLEPNGIIQYYEVYLAPLTFDYLKNTSIRTLDDVQHLKVENLKPFTSYLMSVRTHTKYGDGGLESYSMLVQTMEDVPGTPPTDLSYKNVSATSVAFSWSKPRIPNGEIVQYTIYYALHEEQESKKLNVGPLNHSVIINNLKPFSKYVVEVSSSTVVGEGEKAMLDVYTAEDEPSSPPHNIIYKQLSSTSIILSWSPPLEPNGVIIDYVVRYGNFTHSFDKSTMVPNVTLTNLEEFSKYEAFIKAYTVVGDGGQESETITFETLEAEPSDPPNNVSGEAISSTSISLHWNPPNDPNGHIQFYSVYYENEHGNEFVKVVRNKTNAVVSELEKYSWYNIFVTASTARGDGGKRSKRIRVRTMAGVPDSPVNNLTATSPISTSLHVKWTKPYSVTGTTYYEITLFQDSILVSSESVKKLEINFENLEAYTTYTVSVSPKVEEVEGNGPQETFTVTTKPDRPSEPVQKLEVVDLTASTVTLMWQPPTKPNGIIDHYLINMKPSNKNVTVLGNLTIIEGLNPYSNYTAIVIASTIVGSGPPAYVHFVTSEDVPGDYPREVKASYMSSTSADITWIPPNTPNGIITHYLIYLEYTSEEGFLIFSVDAENISQVLPYRHILMNLEPYTDYKVSMSSGTKIGEGPPSPSIQFTTEEDVPGAPHSVHCTTMNEKEVNVTWTEPKYPNGEIIGYKIGIPIQGKEGVETVMEVNFPKQYLIVDNLLPFTKYRFEVQAVTKIGVGETTYCNSTTKEGYASPPTNIHVIASAATSLKIGWDEPNRLNGILTHYVVFYKPPHSCGINSGSNLDPIEKSNCMVIATKSLKEVLLKNLESNYAYEIRVAAQNGRGLGEESSVQSFRTNIGAPTHAPEHIHARPLSSSVINVSWSEPLEFSGPTKYQVIVRKGNKEAARSDILDSNTRQTVVSELKANTLYFVSVAAFTYVGSKESVSVEVTTSEDSPSDSPVRIAISGLEGNSSTVQVHFLPPLNPNGVIVRYRLQYKLLKSKDIKTINMSAMELPNNDEGSNWWTVTNMLGGREYIYRMNADTEVGSGPWSPWSDPVLMPITAPSTHPEKVKLIGANEGSKVITSSTTIQIPDICVFSDENGPLAKIDIIVVEDQENLHQEPTEWLIAHQKDPIPPYKVVATTRAQDFCFSDSSAFHRRKKRSIKDKGFVLGTDNDCLEKNTLYCNGPLKSDTPYRLKFRGETTTGESSESPFSNPIRTEPTFLQSNMNLIIGIAAALGVLIVIFIISYFALRKRRRLLESDQDTSLTSEEPGSKRQGRERASNIPVHQNLAFVMEPTETKKKNKTVLKQNFAEHISRMSKNKQKGFVAEFDELKSLVKVGSRDIGSRECNASKNRYSNIMPYDHSCVKIDGISAIEGSDYINASYIPGPKSPEQYIATQAPLDHTQNDLWRMVWETGVTTMVMLCNIHGEGKDRCSEYWPGAEVEYFGNLAIQTTQEDRQPEWTIRKFTITRRDKVRQITQFNFIQWPVRGVPDHAQAFVRFIRTVHANISTGSHPMLVMCSSGSGRSAVFIALDLIIDSIRTENYVDPYSVVANLRAYRPYMIQTVAEYMFLHQCIQEVLESHIPHKSSVQPTGDGAEETTMF